MQTQRFIIMVSAHSNGMNNGFHGKGDAPRPVPSGTILFKVRDLARCNASLRGLKFYPHIGLDAR